MKTYHDYVIKDGKFIGEFEKMYQEFEDPWMQSKQPNPYGRQCAIMNIKRFNIKSLIEFGCGLGYYADWIYKDTGIVPKGIDISPTAIQKAKKNFPHLDFEEGDVMNMEVYADEKPDAILFSEIGWYILEDFDSILDQLLHFFRGKYFINNLVFYKGTQTYGNKLFTNLTEYIDYVPFKLIGYAEASTIHDSNIDTTALFKIEEK